MDDQPWLVLAEEIKKLREAIERRPLALCPLCGGLGYTTTESHACPHCEGKGTV